MFSVALVALDLSPAALPIVGCLPELLRWGVHRVVLCHVIPIGYTQAALYGQSEKYVAWLDARADELRAEGLDVTIAVREGAAPGAEILTAARDAGADLLVIGSRAQSMVRSIFLGSVARSAIRSSTIPVLLQWIEPTANATEVRCETVCRDTLAHVLLATDFSRDASRAEETAVELAQTATLTDCITVVTGAARGTAPPGAVMAKASLQAVMDRITKAGGRGEAIVAEGEPVEMILHEARSRGCTLIIVGKHGANWVKGALIGSTAAQLCERARRPVLVVPSA